MKVIETSRDYEIYKAKQQILKVIPFARDIEIKLSKDGQYFETSAKVKANKRRLFVAVKKDKCLKVSLEKATSSIIKQVSKSKGKKKVIRRKVFTYFNQLTEEAC